MPAFIPETGAGVPYANSYVSLEYADDYFAGHPFYADRWTDMEVVRKQHLLAAASAQLDVLYDWQGLRSTPTQGLAWPRTGVYDTYGAYVSPYDVPDRLRRAVCEQAIQLSRGDPAETAADTTGIGRIKIDVIELDFTEGGPPPTSKAPSAAPAAAQLLRGLGVYANGLRVRRVLVG